MDRASRDNTLRKNRESMKENICNMEEGEEKQKDTQKRLEKTNMEWRMRRGGGGREKEKHT